MAYLLHHLLDTSTGRDPGRCAVAHRDRRISYRELAAASDRLAWSLRAHGVERGDRVGIYLDKSIEAVVAVFGILKSGAAYVPLDPSAPAKRVAYIIANCAMKALVSTRKRVAGLAPALPEPGSLRCAVLADGGEGDRVGAGALAGASSLAWSDVMGAAGPGPDPVPLIEDDLAYILYTSGSTGEPKGVMISHRGSLTFVDWASDCFRIGPEDRLSNHAPLHFDLSTFDLFAAIKAGATVVLVPEELSLFPIQLADFIAEHQITTWYSVPSVLTRLVLHGELARHRYPALRTILFAGEVFPTRYLRQLVDLVPGADYYNLYGPTETNVCTYYQVDKRWLDSEEAIPIGRACANTEVFALTDQQEPVPPGEVGELHVRGPSLMKGYWGLPEKTDLVLAPRRLPPTMYPQPVYRTGDLVRLGGDGNYRFLGRRDNMIKSRGYRIELGEIESALYRHPRVEEAVVLAIPDDQIGNSIRAVVVARGAGPLTRGELESFCSSYLPRYMIPMDFEFRRALPKTSTGKVDRNRLLEQQLNGPSE